MIDAALPYLRCPVCEQSLRRCEQTVRCPAGHAFDLARQGYLNLTAGPLRYDGDTVEMVADRAAFLAAGHYDFLAAELARLAARYAPDGLVVDAGTGTGHYLARVLDAVDTAIGLGVDVAKPALRRAARAHPRAAAVRADLWRPLPIVDAAAAMILDVFAPRNGPEFHRVLHPDGVLVVVTPAAEHLAELIAEYGLLHVDPDKASRVEEALAARFIPAGASTLRRTLRLTADETRTLIGMTPSAHHVRTATLDARPRTVTAAVTIAAYHPK